jgi:hypothetical protein
VLLALAGLPLLLVALVPADAGANAPSARPRLEALPPVLLEVDDGSGFGFRPLAGALVPDLRPVVRVTVLAPGARLRSLELRTTAAGRSVTGRSAKPETTDLTRLVGPLRTGETATRTLVLEPGSHVFRVEVQTPAGVETVEAGMAAFGRAADGLATPTGSSFRIEKAIGVPVEEHTILLFFRPATPLDAVSAELGRLRLAPLDWSPEIGLVRARILDRRSPYRLARDTAADLQPPVVGVSPNLLEIPADEVGEETPKALADTYQAATGGFKDAELRAFRYHYYYDTFAGLRLVHRLLRGVTGARPVGIAIVDSGFGNGRSPNPTSIPDSALFNFASAPFEGFNASGVQLCGGNPCDFASDPVKGLKAVEDLPTPGHEPHGTRVATAAAGRPGQMEGTAPDARIRIIRVAEKGIGMPLTDAVKGVEAAALDPNVDVVNTSLGGSDFTPAQTTLNQKAARDQATIVVHEDPKKVGFSVGDEVRIGLGGTQEARTIAGIDGHTITLTANLRMDHAKGEPVVLDIDWLAPLRGQGVTIAELARRNGKIWTAAAGNDGHCTDPSPTRASGPCGRTAAPPNYPSDLAPGRTRTSDTPLVMSVGATGTETETGGPETLARFSNYGPRLSVVAGGDKVVLQDEKGKLGPHNGTSFAAPTVAGLAAEMIFLDRNLAGARRLSPLEIVELIEATADDLGTTGRSGDAPWPNDNPANGYDIQFGHGRINVWKALLAVANGGTASDRSGPFPATHRASIGDDTWFGFSIRSPVRGATLWLDGRQLKDSGQTQVTGKTELSAAKGVDSSRVIQRGIDVNGDGIPDEDPTSGVVPVGVDRGEYIATFSIQKRDLERCDNRPCTLSLRRPDDGVDKAPFWSLRLELDKLMQNKVPGVVFDDFVFEVTPTDFGDAPPPYPTRLLADQGAYSQNASLEWFGPNRDTGVAESDNWLLGVSPEPDAADEVGGPSAAVDPDGTVNTARKADLDRFDDGIVFYPRSYTPGGKGRVDFTICVADPKSNRYVARQGEQAADRELWVNGWIDWNTNGAWEETGDEHVVDGVRIRPGDWSVTKGSATRIRPATVTGKPPNCATFKAEFKVHDPIGGGPEKLWARFRLDYGENAGRNDPRPVDGKGASWRSDPKLSGPKGPSRFGEVEDYLIGTDYGDAQDPPFPSRHASKGAYVLNFNREWLGKDADYASATRELDACDKTSAEEDGTPNLGPTCSTEDADKKDDGASVPAQVEPGQEVAVPVTVSAQIDTRGFSNRGPGPDASAPDSKGVMTTRLGACDLVAIPDMPDTPVIDRDRGRYSAWTKEKRLFLNAWVDANADGVWENTPDEYFIQHRPIDPETFGGDGKYTLGEPFDDKNKDGVFTPGVDTFTDVAGKSEATFVCTAKISSEVPDGAKIRWRFRLDYGEDGAENPAVVRFAGLPEGESRNLGGYLGGSWWGEVEDYVSIVKKTPPPDTTESTGTTAPTTTATTGATTTTPAPTGTTAPATTPATTTVATTTVTASVTTSVTSATTPTTGTVVTGTSSTGATTAPPTTAPPPPTTTAGTTATTVRATSAAVQAAASAPPSSGGTAVWAILAFGPLLPFLAFAADRLRRRRRQSR